MRLRPTPETDCIVRNAANNHHPTSRLAATLTVKCEKLERERDEALNVLREINDWINVAAMRPKSEITTNEAADAINTWGDKIRPILGVTE